MFTVCSFHFTLTCLWLQTPSRRCCRWCYSWFCCFLPNSDGKFNTQLIWTSKFHINIYIKLCLESLWIVLLPVNKYFCYFELNQKLFSFCWRKKMFNLHVQLRWQVSSTLQVFQALEDQEWFTPMTTVPDIRRWCLNLRHSSSNIELVTNYSQSSKFLKRNTNVNCRIYQK